MDNKKDQVLQIRLSSLEKTIIKEKADLLEMSVTDYVKKCCIYTNISNMFKESLKLL